MKYPHGIFSSKYLSNQFNFKVIVLLRNPFAFAASIVKQGWFFDFSNILCQNKLVEHYFPKLKTELNNQIQHEEDIIGSAILQWKLIYKYLKDVHNTYQDCLLLKHESLSTEPIKYFSSIFNFIGIPFTERSKRIVYNYSLSNKSEAPKGHVTDVKINSKKNLGNWKKYLNNNDINRIYRETYDLATYFSYDLDNIIASHK